MTSDDLRHLDPRVVLVWRAGGLLLALLLATAAALVGWVAARPDPAWTAFGPAVAIAVVGLASAVVGPRLAYDRWSYAARAEALELRHGILTRRRAIVPYYRVQHIDITAGPLERSLGLVRLVIHTASAATDSTLPGIARDDGDALRQVILDRAGRGDAV